MSSSLCRYPLFSLSLSHSISVQNTASLTSSLPPLPLFTKSVFIFLLVNACTVCPLSIYSYFLSLFNGHSLTQILFLSSCLSFLMKSFSPFHSSPTQAHTEHSFILFHFHWIIHRLLSKPFILFFLLYFSLSLHLSPPSSLSLSLSCVLTFSCSSLS